MCHAAQTHMESRKSVMQRKRKRTVGNEQQKNLEDALYGWIKWHDATHGSRIPLSDAMIVEQVCA